MAGYRKRGKNWYFKFIDASGRPVERKGCPDKRVTEELARAAEIEAARTKAGLIDPFARHRTRPIDEHVGDFIEFLKSKGVTPKHVATTATRLRAVLTGCEVASIADLDATRIAGWLAQRRAAGMSNQTSNYYQQCVAGFSRWLVKHRRMPDNPLVVLTPLNTKVDRRHDRGVLSTDEFDALIRATRSAKTFRGLTGEDRAALYQLATWTGLRVSELASLNPASFDLDADQPVVRVRAGYTKNGAEAVIPLRHDLCTMLRSYLAGRPEDGPVWPGTWVKRGAPMIYRDLERAGVAHIDADGRYRDFHSLRHRFGSELAKANVPPKVAQALMRHSTIVLTMDRYSHVGLHDTAGAIDKLPPFPSETPATEPARMHATGTEGHHINNHLATRLPLSRPGSERSLSDPDAGRMVKDAELGSGNSQTTTPLVGLGRIQSDIVVSPAGATLPVGGRIYNPPPPRPNPRFTQVLRVYQGVVATPMSPETIRFRRDPAVSCAPEAVPTSEEIGDGR